MPIIPDNLTDFLYWFKEQTEAVWAKTPKGNSEDNWFGGAKWIGMKEADIGLIEQKYGVKFMPEHREFLKILHTVDRKEIREYNDEREVTPFFYNWYEDKEEIRDRLAYPFDVVLFDILKGFWLKSWGTKPDSDDEKKRIFTEWYNKAPALIPLYAHRFLVSDAQLVDRPILSVWGTDIIVYGWDLRHYLMSELSYLFHLYTGQDGEGPTELGKEVEAYHKERYDSAKSKSIPYWEEIIY